MNTKLIVLLGSVGVAHLVVGGLILTGGCAQEDPPMPPGIYVPKQNPQQEPTPGYQPAPAPQPTAGPQEAAPQETPYHEPVAVPEEPKTKAKPAEGHHGDRAYIVVKNDSLWLIARKNGLTIEELASYNNLSPKAKLKIGQKLYIPAAGKKAVRNKPQGKAKAKPAPGKKGKKHVKPAGKGKAGAKSKLPEDGIYTVKAGDNFSFIAKRYGIKVSDIQAANPGVNSNKLHVGQKLRLTAGAAPVPKSAAKAGKAGKKTAAKKGKKAAKKSAAKPAAAAPAAEAAEAGAAAEAKKTEQPAEKTSAEKPASDDAESLLNTVKQPSEKAPDEKAKDDAATQDSVKAVVPDSKNPMAVVPDKDRVITGSNNKTEVIIGEDTTLTAFCKKFQVSEDAVRQRNASIPANGQLKKGARISLIGDEDPAI